MKVLIVGGVAGGATAAARLRRLDEKAEIIVFERSGYVSYANCGLPYYVGDVITDEKKLTLQTPQSFKSRFNIDIRVKNEVTAIDRSAKTVTVCELETGREYTENYDKLILAPGAKAVIPPIEGARGERVFTLKTVEDTFRVKAFVSEQKPKRAVVIGGGFIGMEMAENLCELGLKVTVVEMLDQILPPLDLDMAREVEGYLKTKGLELALSRAVESISENGGALSVKVSGSDAINCDMVVMSVGVAPESALAKNAGLELGQRGGIVVDRHMCTSDPDIYAVGDAVLVENMVTGQSGLTALAGPANKEGRIAADNICGIKSEYKGALGSSVIKLFDMTVASTGLSEKAAKAAGIACDKVMTYSASHAGYYPGGTNMSVKTVFDPETGKLLGAQIVGFDGVDKRIDVLATSIYAGLTAHDLQELDLAYAPPYSSAKDPVNMAGFTMCNILEGRLKQYHWHDVASLPRDGSVTILDVRTPSEYEQGHIDGSILIPLDSLREHLSELDPSKPLYVNCRSGLRSYIACRILTQNGFDCYNLSGGFRFYEAVTGNPPYDESRVGECGLKL